MFDACSLWEMIILSLVERFLVILTADLLVWECVIQISCAQAVYISWNLKEASSFEESRDIGVSWAQTFPQWYGNKKLDIVNVDSKWKTKEKKKGTTIDKVGMDAAVTDDRGFLSIQKKCVLHTICKWSWNSCKNSSYQALVYHLFKCQCPDQVYLDHLLFSVPVWQDRPQWMHIIHISCTMFSFCHKRT